MRVLIVVMLCAGVAAAQPVDPAVKARSDAAYAEGSTAYQAGDFKRAALKFEEAYSLVADPAFLFNIGQAYRQGNECVKSEAAFAKFIELAPSAPNIANAKQLHEEVSSCAVFVEGRRLMGAGRPGEACEKFKAAFADDPDAIGVILNLGLCNEQSGKLATAARFFRLATVKGMEEKVPEAVEDARQHLAGMLAKIPKIDIAVATGATVKLDGEVIADRKNVEVDPGRHTLEVSAPGYAPQTKSFEIALEKHDKIAFELEALPTPGTSNRLAYVLGATGLTLWAGTAVLGFYSKDRYDDAATFDEQNKWKNVMRYGGTAMFVAGTAAIGTSVVLYIRNRNRRTETTAVAPAVGTHHIGIVLGGAF